VAIQQPEQSVTIAYPEVVIDKSLNMRAWLKVNHDSLVDMGM